MAVPPWQIVVSGPIVIEHIGWASTAYPSAQASTKAAHPVRDMRWLFKMIWSLVKFRAVEAQVFTFAALFVHDAVNTRLIPW